MYWLMQCPILAAHRSKGLANEPEFWIFVACVVVLVATFVWGRRSRNEEVAKLEKEIKQCRNQAQADLEILKESHRKEINRRVDEEYGWELRSAKWRYEQELSQYRKARDEEVQTCKKERDSALQQAEYAKLDRTVAISRFENSVELLRKDCIAFPSVAKRLDLLLANQDEAIARLIAERAPRSADEVRMAKAQRRKLFQECMLLRTRMEVYESLAPWLESYMECSLNEVLEAKAEEERLSQTLEVSEPSERRYLTADEYSSLSEVERSQLALDRYWDKSVKRNLWLVGIQYERYIGYLYERDGYDVLYHGALRGKEDLGVDLIARKGQTVHVVQCKRYSEIKRIPVRENAVAQVFGAAKVLQFENGYKKVVPVVITSFELSDEARRFADALKVKVREHLALESYPCIKCNVGKDGVKIYHLPFDQMYDHVKIEPDKGEFFASTVQEAYLCGFRRAYRWHG